MPPSEVGRFWNFDTEFTQFSDNFYAKFIPLEMFKYLEHFAEQVLNIGILQDFWHIREENNISNIQSKL